MYLNKDFIKKLLLILLIGLSSGINSDELTRGQALEYIDDSLKLYGFAQKETGFYIHSLIGEESDDYVLRYVADPINDFTYNSDDLRIYLKRILDLTEKLYENEQVKETININQLTQLVVNAVTQISLLRATGHYRPESGIDFNEQTDYSNIESQILKLLGNYKGNLKLLIADLLKVLMEKNYGQTYEKVTIEKLFKERDEKRKAALSALEQFNRSKEKIEKLIEEEAKSETSWFEELGKMTPAQQQTLLKDRLNEFINFALDAKLFETTFEALSKFDQEKIAPKIDEKSIEESIDARRLGLSLIMRLTLENFKDIEKALKDIIDEIESNNKFDEKVKTDLLNKFNNNILGKLKFKIVIPDVLKKYLKEFPNLMTDLNEKGANQFTALHVAATNGDLEGARALIELGANVNALGILNITPIMQAAYYDHADVVKLLLDNNADTSLRTSNTTQTALDIARARNNKNTIDVLEKK